MKRMLAATGSAIILLAACRVDRPGLSAASSTVPTSAATSLRPYVEAAKAMPGSGMSSYAVVLERRLANGKELRSVVVVFCSSEVVAAESLRVKVGFFERDGWQVADAEFFDVAEKDRESPEFSWGRLLREERINTSYVSFNDTDNSEVRMFCDTASREVGKYMCDLWRDGLERDGLAADLRIVEGLYSYSR